MRHGSAIVATAAALALIGGGCGAFERSSESEPEWCVLAIFGTDAAFGFVGSDADTWCEVALEEWSTPEFAIYEPDHELADRPLVCQLFGGDDMYADVYDTGGQMLGRMICSALIDRGWQPYSD